MNMTKDIILSNLVQKKKSLLDELLVHSIRSVCEGEQEEATLKKRSDLLKMLEINDNAIARREKQTGIKATGQEKALLLDIRTLLSSIKDNNQATLLKLEAIEKSYEAERSRLGTGKKLSSYVAQTNSINQYRKKGAPANRAQVNRAKGKY
jgi:hypothetical protein